MASLHRERNGRCELGQKLTYFKDGLVAFAVA